MRWVGRLCSSTRCSRSGSPTFSSRRKAPEQLGSARLALVEGSSSAPISARGSRGHRRSTMLMFAGLGMSITSTSAVADGCKLGRIAEFPIVMVGMRPLMTAKINDVDVQFVLDSGAFYSSISAASASELKLRISSAPFGFYVVGVHGAADVSIG